MERTRKMKYTRRDFEVMAACIKRGQKGFKDRYQGELSIDESDLAWDMAQSICSEFVTFFEQNNPDFDRRLFMVAAGIIPPKYTILWK